MTTEEAFEGFKSSIALCGRKILNLRYTDDIELVEEQQRITRTSKKD